MTRTACSKPGRSGRSGAAPFLNTFDAAGARTNTTSVGFDVVGGIDADSAGNLYVTTDTVIFDTFGITRFTASGAVDGAFGTGGTVTAAVPGTFALAFDVAVNADDKPIAFGLSDGDVALAREDRAAAAAHFRTALSLDPGNDYARAALERLRE